MFQVALAKDPAGRPSDIGDWGEQLASRLEGEPESTSGGWPLVFAAGSAAGDEVTAAVRQSDVLTAPW